MVDRAAPLVLAGRRLARATSLTAALFLLLFAVIPPRVAWLPAAHAATGPVISMDGGMNPATVTVTPGITVTWTSTDGQKHRVRSTSGPTKFDSGGLNPGQSFTFTFGSLGTYAYVDDEHKNDPGAAGSVTVATSVPPGGGGGGGGGGGAASGTVNASIANRAFNPSSFSVTVGTTIVWTNNDKESHTVTARSGAFDSGNVGVGATYRTVFNTVGSFPFVCTIHPSMVGVVAVSAAGAPAPPPPPPPAPPPAPAPPPPPAAGSNTIQIIDYAFRPATITINAGTTLTWTNVGQAVHTVTAGDGSFASGNVRAGTGQYTHPFATAGTFTYICDIHPDMTATVVVNGAGGQPAPPPAPTTTVPIPVTPATGGIRIVDFNFEPTSITIAQGGSVTFVNAGVARHTATADDGSFDSGLMARGGVFRKEFAKAGTFTFYCQLHPQMKGTVLVTGAGGTPPPAAPPVAKPPTPATAGDVKMLDFAFSPTSISVKEGATVTFANNGQAPHTVTAKDGSFDSGFVQPGKTYVRTFARAGTFNYVCNIHPQMTATVLVSGAGGTPPPPAAPDAPKSAPPPATGDVRMLDFSFSPTDIRVVAGGTVTFGNAGQAPHTVTAKDGSFDSGFVPPGQQWIHTFAKAGTFNFICNIHPQMTGTLLVTGAGGEAPPPAAPEVTKTTPPPATGDVRMLDFSFSPGQIKVVQGGSITFGNAGQAPHTVTARDGSFDSGFVPPGGQWTHKFPATGTFSFLCQLHPQMTGTVLVTGANGEAPPPDQAPATSAAPTLPPGAGDVRMVDFGFAPAQITVVTGGKVSFANAGQAPHTVTAKDGSFDSKIVKPGETYDHVFAAAGTFNYFCDLHPQMTGTVLVTGANGEAPPPAAADSGGNEPPPLVLAAKVKVNPSSYEPSAVTIAIGGTVTWTIASEAPRYITADDQSFDSGLLAEGRTFTYTFKVAGTFGYHDRIVNGMAGSVNVVDPATAGTKGAAGDGRSAGVAIVDNSFDPPEVSVKAGGTVSWTNTGKAKHTVTVRDGSWTSDLLAFGARYQKTFDTPGTFDYYCTLHPGMVGKLTVTNDAGEAPAAVLDAAAPAAKDSAESSSSGGLGWLTLGNALVAVVAGGVAVSVLVFARTFKPGSGYEGLEVEAIDDGDDDPDDPGHARREIAASS